MKRFLPLLALLVCVIPVRAAVSHVASGQGFCNNATFGGNMPSTCVAPAATKTFTYTPGTLHNALFIGVGCAAASPAPTVTLTASGWTITAESAVTGSTGNYMASFAAVAPNTSATTFTVTWSKSCASFMNDLIEEFTGNDTTGGATTFDAKNQATNTGSCTTTVTPANNNDGLAGMCNDSVTAAGSGFNAGANDTLMDWGEWKILSGGSGASQTVNFTGSGTYIIVAVSIKPATAAGVTPRMTLLGVGP